jgi:hypothetical protein
MSYWRSAVSCRDVAIDAKLNAIGEWPRKVNGAS